MASVFKPSGRNVYRIEFKDQHNATQVKSAGTKDRRVAEARALLIERDADRIRAGLPPEHPEVTGPYLGLVDLSGRQAVILDLLDAYLAALTRRRKRPATITHRRAKIGRLVAACCWERLADVTAESLTRFLTRLSQDGRSASTCNA